MKRDNVNYAVVGVFVLLVFAAFIALMFRLTGHAGPADHYVVHYANVTGLKFGTGVFYEGYQVGQVERITPVQLERGVHYKLDLSVEQGWRIPADSVAEVVASGLISQVQIQIQQGDSARSLEPGMEIRGIEQRDLFSALSAAASGINDLSQTGVAPVLRTLDARITEVADELVDFRRRDLSPLVRGLHQHLNGELVPQAARTLASLDASAARLERILGSDNERRIGELLQHADQVALGLGDLVQRVEQTRQQMDGVLHDLDALIARNDAAVDEAVAHARAALAKLDSSLGVVDERIGSVMYHLEGSAQQTHELTRALRQNPARLLRSDAVPATAVPP
ncbi:MAG: MCE family protein [Gammaproteobacteria bacterium]|nr:MCE family protein [Gammaproteobacteria bacterium]